MIDDRLVILAELLAESLVVMTGAGLALFVGGVAFALLTGWRP